MNDKLAEKVKDIFSRYHNRIITAEHAMDRLELEIASAENGEEEVQFVAMDAIDPDDDKAYQLVGMTSSTGFFVFVQVFNTETWEWEQDDTFTQWQLWEDDHPDFMKAQDILTTAGCLEFFEGQGLEYNKPIG
jgi:hypothetical protein